MSTAPTSTEAPLTLAETPVRRVGVLDGVGLGRLPVLADARGGPAALAMVEQAVAASAPVVQVRAKDCADYLGVGPAYPTTTKTGLPAALGPAGIAAGARAVDVPVIAIGGVTAARVPELLAAGAWGATVDLLRALDWAR